MTPQDISIPSQNWLMRRIFVWTCGLALLGLWAMALLAHQNTWPIAAVLALLIFVYVTAATAEQVVSVVQSAGVMKAVASATNVVTTAADAASGMIATVETTVGGAKTIATTSAAPAPTPPGARDDLAV